jgi:hypothetical protein
MKYLHEKVIIGGGIWLILLPYTGFPSSWKSVFTVVTGIAFAYIGLLRYKKIKKAEQANHTEIKTGTFTESL